jgi:hypothetical protein
VLISKEQLTKDWFFNQHLTTLQWIVMLTATILVCLGLKLRMIPQVANHELDTWSPLLIARYSGWVSKLQTEIALSVCAREAEFVALSQSFRSSIPTKQLLQETLKRMDLKMQVHYRCKSTVFEDNAAALGIATKDATHGSQIFLVLGEDWRGLAEVVKIESDKNWADIFTKNCGTIVFQCTCKLMYEW